MPSKENTPTEVPTSDVDIVTTPTVSPGEPVLLTKHARLVPDVHDAVEQPARATWLVAVRSTVWKLRPDTVRLRTTEYGLLAAKDSLTTGAVLRNRQKASMQEQKDQHTSLAKSPSKVKVG